jgi:hypothetical protein
MCYEVAIASSGKDDATLAKSVIISLEGVAANWYSRLPPRCIHSWQQLKEKLQINYQGFQADLSREKDVMSSTKYENETLLNFCQRFLQLKAHYPGFQITY